MFIFFKQKTAYEMRISDWSSDVCSSDLILPQMPLRQQVGEEGREFKAGRAEIGQQLAECVLDAQAQNRPGWITAISLIESEQGALAAHISEGADGLAVEPDEKGGSVCPYR